MIEGRDNNSSKDNRSLFVRFLNPIWQGVTKVASIHNGILGGISKKVTDVLEDLLDSKKESYLDSATGEFLDKWGSFVGLTRRPGEDDDTYRERIKKYIMVLRGTIPAIKDALYDYFGDHNAVINIYEPYVDIFYTNRSLLNSDSYLQGDYYRYGIIDISIDRPFDYDAIMEVINKFKPAGVMVYITYNPSLNTGIGVIDGLYNYFSIEKQSIEVESFTGYKATKLESVQLATSSLELASNIFRTNKSDLNSLDVLAGSPATSGRPSIHTTFTAGDITPTNEQSVIDLALLGEECDSTMYTATTFVGGSKADIELSTEKSLYQALNLSEYHSLVNKEDYVNQKIQYIKIEIENSKRGMDIGYLTALGEDGQDKAIGGVWAISQEGTPGYIQKDNGDNILNDLDRRSFATLKLAEPAILKSIQVDNSYNNEAIAGIYVSTDGQEYYTMYFGEFSNRAYPLLADTLIGNSDLTYKGYLSRLYTDLTYSLKYEVKRFDVETVAEIFNFTTGEWDIVGTSDKVVTYYDKLVGKGIANYVSDVGVIVTRLRALTTETFYIDYFSLGLLYHKGFRYTLEQGIEIMKPSISLELSNGDLSLFAYQVYLIGDSFGADTYYYTPIKRIRMKVNAKDEDPNKDKYFKFSSIPNVSETSDLTGFDAGVLAGDENIDGDDGVTITFNRTKGKPPIVVKGTVVNEYVVVDFNGWMIDIESVQISCVGYTLQSFQIPNYRTSTTYSKEFVTGQNNYTISSEFFRRYYPYSKTNNGELLDNNFLIMFNTCTVTAVVSHDVGMEHEVSETVTQEPIT